MDAGDGSREAPEPGSLAGVSSDFEDSLLRRIAGSSGEGSRIERHESGVPAIGSVLDGKYHLDRLLGRGGMGFVFAARNLTTGRHAAIKWMRRRGDLDQLRKRFVREARAAGRIRHPNVIDIYDVVSDEHATYLVMELLEGESLRARLDRGRLEPTEAVEIALSVLEGLREAHQQGVIHRDLKPENVFLCSSPKSTKVVDFGISVLSETRPAAESNLTHTGYFVGTPVYTALERLREKQPFDHRVDLYSVGVILYEALTGELPFSGKTPSELTYQLTLSSPRPLRDFRPELAPALQAVVLRALARNPDERFQDAQSLINALQSALEARRWRHAPRAVAMAVALGVVGLSATAALRGRSAAADAPAPPATFAAMETRVPIPFQQPVETDAVVPAPAPIAELHKPPAARRPASKPARPAVAPAPAPVASGAKRNEGSAELSVIVFPYGDVWVDGRRVGSSPARLTLPPGMHVVSGGRTSGEREAKVELVAGQSRDVVLSWARTPGAGTPSKDRQELAPADGESTGRKANSDGTGLRHGPAANEIGEGNR